MTSPVRSALSGHGAVAIGWRAAVLGVRDAWSVHRRWMTAVAVVVAVMAVGPAAQVWLVAGLVEAVDGDSASAVWGRLLGLTAVVGLSLPLGQVGLACSQRLALRMRLHYRIRVVEAAAAAAPVDLARPEVVARLQAGHEAAGEIDTIAGDVIRLAGAAVTAIALCVSVWSISPEAGLLVLASLVPTLVAFSAVARAESSGWPLVGEHERRAAYATEQLLQQRTGTELATLGTGAKVAAVVAEQRRVSMTVLDRLIGVAMRAELLAAAGTVALVSGALAAVILGRSSGAQVAAAVVGVIAGLQAIRASGYAFGAIMAAAPKAEILRTLHPATPPRPDDSDGQGVDEVRLTDVTVTYPGAVRPALQEVSLTARRGELIALVGINGAGKTTAMHAMLGVVAADHGRVDLDGRDAATLPPPTRLARFGLLSQEFGRYEFTIRESVALGTPRDVTDAEIWAALAAAKADAFVRELPGGLDSQLGQQWGGTGLSGGQWQRIALARIHLRDAPIWVLDEPTSAIDAEAEQLIFAELKRTTAHRVTLVVSHRAWTLRHTDAIYVFDHGRIVQHGTYPDLISRPGRFREIFAEQSGARSERPPR